MQVYKNLNLKRDPPRKWKISYIGFIHGVPRRKKIPVKKSTTLARVSYCSFFDWVSVWEI